MARVVATRSAFALFSATLGVSASTLAFAGGAAAQSYEDQYLVGDWDGDGDDNLAVRRGNCVLMDFNGDGAHDLTQCYGDGNNEDEYLVGDWDGDRRDNLAVRRGHCVLKDYNFDGAHDATQCYGDGDNELRYLVGDWDGVAVGGEVDHLGVARKNASGQYLFLLDVNGDGAHDITAGPVGSVDPSIQLHAGDFHGYGYDYVGGSRNQLFAQTIYASTRTIEDWQVGDRPLLIGDWNGDRKSGIGVLRGHCVHKDDDLTTLNFAQAANVQCFGNGLAPVVPVAAGVIRPVASFAPATSTGDVLFQ